MRFTHPAFSAMLMAMFDGIQNKIDPGEPLDKDIIGSLAFLFGPQRSIGSQRQPQAEAGLFGDDQLEKGPAFHELVSLSDEARGMALHAAKLRAPCSHVGRCLHDITCRRIASLSTWGHAIISAAPIVFLPLLPRQHARPVFDTRTGRVWQCQTPWLRVHRLRGWPNAGRMGYTAPSRSPS